MVPGSSLLRLGQRRLGSHRNRRDRAGDDVMLLEQELAVADDRSMDGWEVDNGSRGRKPC